MQVSELARDVVALHLALHGEPPRHDVLAVLRSWLVAAGREPDTALPDALGAALRALAGRYRISRLPAEGARDWIFVLEPLVRGTELAGGEPLEWIATAFGLAIVTANGFVWVDVPARMRTEPVIAEPLWSAMQACEVRCVAGCCGLAAFDLDAKWLEPWVAEHGPDALAVALRQVGELAEVTAASKQVVSRQLNVVATTAEWARILADWRHALEVAQASLGT